jgi:arylsulfatase A-like enzyme
MSNRVTQPPAVAVGPWQPWRERLGLAAWFALAGGLCEAELSLHVVPPVQLHGLIGADAVWMAPLFNFLLYAAMMMPFAWLDRRREGARGGRVYVWLVALASSFGVACLFHPALHKVAGLLIAAGVATQCERWLNARPARRAWMVRSVPVLLVAVAVAGAAPHIRSRLSERAALASLPAAAPGAPNVILIVLDTVRDANLDFQGYARQTAPHLGRFAARGVRFERALSTAPWTLPSHASMFTGRYPHELSATWTTPLDATYATVAEAFRARGYQTAGFVGNVSYCSYRFGLSRGFIHYDDFPVNAEQVVLSASLARFVVSSPRFQRLTGRINFLARKSARAVNEEFLTWLSARRKDRPFFAFANYFDAHDPYIPPPPFDRRFGSGAVRPLRRVENLKRTHPGIHQGMINAYDGAIAYLDFELGTLFRELKRRRLLDDTVIVVTSDHGEEFAEHGAYGHGNGVYLPSVLVPLVVVGPQKVPAGVVVHEPVTLRDLAATLTDLAGFDAGFPGTSLRRYWEDSAASPTVEASPLLSEVGQVKNRPAWIPSSRGSVRALTSGGWRYIQNSCGDEELFDFDHDPLEQSDLRQSDAGRAALASLRLSLARLEVEPGGQAAVAAGD